jgi:transposase
MLALSPATRIFLAVGVTDMRKSFNGLCDLARQRLAADPVSGHLFVFCNRRRNRLKILYWDGSGLWVCSKRLEKGCFSWPQAVEGEAKATLRSEELMLLLGGIDLDRTRTRQWWRKAA